MHPVVFDGFRFHQRRQKRREEQEEEGRYLCKLSTYEDKRRSRGEKRLHGVMEEMSRWKEREDSL